MVPEKLFKLSAQGNDFLLADTRLGDQQHWPEIAADICSRHTGLGADGLLVLDVSDVAAARYRMFNPDGTEDFCINGLGCAANYMISCGWVESDTITLETVVGLRNISITKYDGSVNTCTAVIEAGVPLWKPSQIPCDLPESEDPLLDYQLCVAGRTILVNMLSTGVTHTIIITDNLSEVDFHQLSPAIELHPLFPNRTCVVWTEVKNTRSAKVRIWERGVGETLSCGSGICATAAVLYKTNRTGPNMRILSRGGFADVAIGANQEVQYAVETRLLFDLAICAQRKLTTRVL